MPYDQDGEYFDYSDDRQFDEDADYDRDEDFDPDVYNPEDEDIGFADPGRDSALRAATPSNPRIHPCPTCHAANVLTPKDVERGYQCNSCANAAERGIDRDLVCGGVKKGCSICKEHSEEDEE